MDQWKIARGKPDSLLWLAATGTTQLPREPFAVIEQRGNPVDVLMTDEISCHRKSADLSFVYWAIGSSDVEICLTDVEGNKFNCTGMLRSTVMPGMVNLEIPPIQKPFRIMISTNTLPGVLIIDDIRSSVNPCGRGSTPPFVREKASMSTVCEEKSSHFLYPSLIYIFCLIFFVIFILTDFYFYHCSVLKLTSSKFV